MAECSRTKFAHKKNAALTFYKLIRLQSQVNNVTLESKF